MRTLGIIALLALGGCGPQGANPTGAVPVRGLAVFADGRPLPAGTTLTFYPERPGGTAAWAVTDARGNFEPRILGDTPGMLPGPHKVVVQPRPGKGAGVPARYAEDATTDLRVDVAAGQELRVQLGR